MNLSASMNSPYWMNCPAGTLPCAFGEHGEERAFWHPAIGSGKTRPSDWYSPSLVATGEATADGTRTATAMTRAVTAGANASRRVKFLPPEEDRNPCKSARDSTSASGGARQLNPLDRF